MLKRCSPVGGAVGHVLCWLIIWQLPASYFPSPLEKKNKKIATSDREGDADTNAGECEHRPQDAGADKPAPGLVQVPVLEGGDGADAGRPPVLGKNNICKRDRCKSSAAASHLARGYANTIIANNGIIATEWGLCRRTLSVCFPKTNVKLLCCAQKTHTHTHLEPSPCQQVTWANRFAARRLTGWLVLWLLSVLKTQNAAHMYLRCCG